MSTVDTNRRIEALEAENAHLKKLFRQAEVDYQQMSKNFQRANGTVARLQRAIDYDYLANTLNDYGWFVRRKIQERDGITVSIATGWAQEFAQNLKSGDSTRLD